MPQTHIVFLPGAGGSPSFWQPLANHLPAAWRKSHLGWPGLGDQPHDPSIRGMDDLVDIAAGAVDGPCVIAAQSMGGIVAVRLALTFADKVRGLILSVTSGGIDLAPHGPTDWRPDYRRNYPRAASWICTAAADHGAELHRIAAPALLLWGDADPISPVSVGRTLADLLPDARLHVVAGGTHDLVVERAAEIAPLVRAHVEQVTSSTA